MKYLPIALLACSLLIQSTDADHPSLRLSKKSSDEVEACFEKCGKDVTKTSKVTQCQNSCVANSVAAGRTRTSIGPNGEKSFVIDLALAHVTSLTIC